MTVEKITLPEIKLTPEQNQDARSLSLLAALQVTLKDLEKHGVAIGPKGARLTWRNAA